MGVPLQFPQGLACSLLEHLVASCPLPAPSAALHNLVDLVKIEAFWCHACLNSAPTSLLAALPAVLAAQPAAAETAASALTSTVLLTCGETPLPARHQTQRLPASSEHTGANNTSSPSCVMYPAAALR
jgi:hypothetical protein